MKIQFVVGEKFPLTNKESQHLLTHLIDYLIAFDNPKAYQFYKETPDGKAVIAAIDKLYAMTHGDDN